MVDATTDLQLVNKAACQISMNHSIVLRREFEGIEEVSLRFEIWMRTLVTPLEVREIIETAMMTHFQSHPPTSV